MNQNDYNKEYLDLAIVQAESAFKLGNYPVGAVMTLDNKIIAKGENKIKEKQSFLNHAEISMIIQVSEQMYVAKKSNPDCKIRVYSTLEPCLQCLGACVTNRVDEIYYIVDDPNGGSTNLKREDLGLAYQSRWPIINKVQYSNKPLDLMITFFRNEIKRGNLDWPQKMLDLYGFN